MDKIIITKKCCTNPNCPHGKELQPISNFHRDRTKADGYTCRCRDCCNKKHTDYYNTHKDKRKEYLLKNKDSIRESKKQHRKSYARYVTYYETLHKYDECQVDPENSELLQVRCKYCGKWFNPTNTQVEHRIGAINGNRSGERHLYCSEACKHSCPTYRRQTRFADMVPGSSREVQPELRKIVLERDNWTCQKCGQSKEENPELELHCHHIDPVVNNPIESADIDNCITLCKRCHKFVHSEIPGCSYNKLRCNY